jgi:hypothetical protein
VGYSEKFPFSGILQKLTVAQRGAVAASLPEVINRIENKAAGTPDGLTLC